MSESSCGNLPGFLLKLVSLLDAPKFSEHVWWSEDGKSFVIKDPAAFTKIVLPAYFKHNNFQSFVRQLNLYGFRKVVLFNEQMRNVTNESVAFFHQYFVKNRAELLRHIKRSTSNTRPFDKLVDEINDLRAKQIKNNTSVFALKRENESLWREVVSLRQKHSHQQKVINHLIKFLVSLVQHQGKGSKRKLPLMIEELSEAEFSCLKVPRTNQTSPASTLSDKTKLRTIDSSPVIREVSGLNADSSLKKRKNLFRKQNLPPKLSFRCDASEQVTTTKDFTTQQNDAFRIAQKEHSAPPDIFSLVVDDDDEDESCKFQKDINVANVSNVDFSMSPSNTSPSLNLSITTPSDHAFSSKPQSSNMPECSEKLSSVDENSNTGNCSKLKKNFQILHEKLSNNEPIHVDCDLMQELFYGSIDLSSQSRLFDESLFSIPFPTLSGQEIVQYSSDGAESNFLNEAELQDNSGNVDLTDLCKFLRS